MADVLLAYMHRKLPHLGLLASSAPAPTTVDLMNALIAVVQAERLADPNNPAMVLCSPSLRRALGGRVAAFHWSRAEELIVRRMSEPPGSDMEGWRKETELILAERAMRGQPPPSALSPLVQFASAAAVAADGGVDDEGRRRHPPPPYRPPPPAPPPPAPTTTPQDVPATAAPPEPETADPAPPPPPPPPASACRRYLVRPGVRLLFELVRQAALPGIVATYEATTHAGDPGGAWAAAQADPCVRPAPERLTVMEVCAEIDAYVAQRGLADPGDPRLIVCQEDALGVVLGMKAYYRPQLPCLLQRHLLCLAD